MILRGQVSDTSTGLPLQAASISYDCSPGGACSPVGQTNAAGIYDITIPEDLNAVITFSYVGYKPVQITAGQLQSTPLIQMIADPQNLAEVTVVAQKKSTIGWYLVAAAVGVYLLAEKDKKRKTISGTDNSELITKVAIAVGLYFFVAKPILQKLNILPDPSEVATDTANDQAIDSSLAAALAVASPTYSDADYAGFADSIYTTITSLIFQGSTVTNILKQMQNDTDILKLQKAYGTRKKCFALGFGCTPQILPGAITDALSNSEIQSVNADYQTKGMAFKF
jgi:CarboxypepD_reg-like domain